MPPTVFTDQSGATPGTALDASHINGLVAADSTEAATNDTLGGSSTLWNNLNRLRYVLGQIQGGAWNAATAMLPLAQKAAASGVASLDANSHVVQYPVTGVRQKKAVTATTDLTGLSAASWTTWPGAEFTALTLPSALQSPGKLVARLFVSAANFSTGAASLQFRLNVNSGAAYVYLGQHQWPTAGGAIEAVTMMGLYTPGSYPFTLSSLSVEYQITGAGPNVQLRTPQSTYTWAAMVLELEECA